MKLSHSGVEKTREGSKVTVFVVEKTREGSSILKLSHSGFDARGVEGSRGAFEKTRERSSILKLSRSGDEKTHEGSKVPVSCSKKRARGR